jgi:DNA-binding transcriptional regulator GbsR (MarR family)
VPECPVFTRSLRAEGAARCTGPTIALGRAGSLPFFFSGSAKPLNADNIVETLDVARSNVSTSLKELQGWGIVRLVHVLGDKRDHFESMKDVWEMFRVVMDERKKREFDPTMRMLHECIAEAAKDKATDEYTEERLRELYKFFETTSALYVQVRRWPTAAMFKFMKTGDKVLKVLGLGA